MLTQQYGDAFREHQKHAGSDSTLFAREARCPSPIAFNRGKFSEKLTA